MPRRTTRPPFPTASTTLAATPQAGAVRTTRAGLRLTAVGLVLTLGTLSACTAKGGLPGPTQDPDEPDQTAAALAAGLARRDLSSVPFTGTTGAEINAQLGPLVTGMGAVRPAVTVAGIDQQGNTATAALHYVWRFPGVTQPWTYDSSARLVQEGGQWKASWQPGILAPGLDGNTRMAQTRRPAPRGKILGADGDAIVAPRPVVRIGIDKTTIAAAAQPAAAARLARLVKVDPKTFSGTVAAAGARDFVPAIVLRADADDRPSNTSVYKIDGAAVFSGDAMLAPTRDFARPVLGTVGEATKETVDTSKGAVAAGDQVGRGGLQQRYDQQLRGTPGVTVRLVPVSPSSGSASPSPTPPPSPSGSATPNPAPLFSSEPVPGKDLSTTLSIPLQNLAEKTLAKTRPASALVAIRPSTGEILAAAGGPGNADQPLATVGRYPPGSTFKVATSLALLRAGLRPSSPVSCPATLTVNGKRFKNYSDYPSSALGRIDLRTAVAQSCNTAFISQRSKVSSAALAEAAASLGLGTDYDVGFSSYFGSVPADPSATGQAAAMIGQGKVLASPMAMAAVAASVSAGRTVVPHLVTGPKVTPRAKPLNRGEADDLRQMTRAVVSEGSGRVLRDLDGPAPLAKTGTAEFGTDSPPQTHAWMIAAQGDLAVAVFVDRGSSGSVTAGPLLKTFLAAA